MQFISTAKGKTQSKGKANSTFTLAGNFTVRAIGKRGHKAYATGYVDYEKLKFISEAKEYGTE